MEIWMEIVFYVPFTVSEANMHTRHTNCIFFFSGGHKDHSIKTGHSAHNKSEPLNSNFPTPNVVFVLQRFNQPPLRRTVYLYNLCNLIIFNS